jgi:hypothetical protein
MRWLLMVLLVSLAALLIAAAGLAHHIWRQRTRHGAELPAAFEPAEDPGRDAKP